jgi:predicted RNA-binding protein with PIN domain
VTFLIDGYNLMHAVGMLGAGPAAGGLERARTRFLDWLADAARKRPEILRVVFDAEKGRGPSSESNHHGVRVRFAFRKTADDEIEELLAKEKRPATVTVVSNDVRIQDAGRRRGTSVNTCEAFVDWLIVETKKRPADADRSQEEQKPEQPTTPDEMAAWLAAFSKPPPKR